MGKYIRHESKSSKVALEAAQSSLALGLGVLTRAKALALQKQQQQLRTLPSPGSYIQLRSRRLDKPLNPKKDVDFKKMSLKKGHPNISPKPCQSNSHSRSTRKRDAVRGGLTNRDDEDEVASYGENDLDLDDHQQGSHNDRKIRETTPCNSVKDPQTLSAPGSSTTPSCSSATTYRSQHSSEAKVPTTKEVDNFFSGLEEQQQKQFIMRYNFDPVNDKPLPGRYKWVKTNP